MQFGQGSKGWQTATAWFWKTLLWTSSPKATGRILVSDPVSRRATNGSETSSFGPSFGGEVLSAIPFTPPVRGLSDSLLRHRRAATLHELEALFAEEGWLLEEGIMG
jgi:hypothetical protein